MLYFFDKKKAMKISAHSISYLGYLGYLCYLSVGLQFFTYKYLIDNSLKFKKKASFLYQRPEKNSLTISENFRLI